MVRQDPDASRRLDGWKAIAAYFNRDRTTAMRWSRERGLPIRRMPGGKQGSVFAFEHELAAWALRQGNMDVDPSADPAVATGARASRRRDPEAVPVRDPELAPPLPPPGSPRVTRGRAVLVAAVAASALAVAAVAWLRQPAPDLPAAPAPVRSAPPPAAALPPRWPCRAIRRWRAITSPHATSGRGAHLPTCAKRSTSTAASSPAIPASPRHRQASRKPG
ncbi:hypothetical protein AB5I41_26290 [Sphingomonas sp. MMS24-JH45]